MGINVEQGEEKTFRGIVGEMIAYVHKIPLSINGMEVETRVAFALSEVPNLSGRLDIFRNVEISDLFQIKINQYLTQCFRIGAF